MLRPESVGKVELNLPPIPKVIRYYDDFADVTRSIVDIEHASSVLMTMDGEASKIDFAALGTLQKLIKSVFLDWIGRLDPHTVVITAHRLTNYVDAHGSSEIEELAVGKISDSRTIWNLKILPNCNSLHSRAIKTILHSMCRMSIGAWTPDHLSYIRTFPDPKVDKYRTVRVGECFLPLDQQALIVNYIDDFVAELAAGPTSIITDDLREVCILIISFQYAFRPGQIARIEAADVRVFETGAVHIAVVAAKQRDVQKRTRVNRRIKREWAPLFIELLKRRDQGSLKGDAEAPERLFFKMTPGSVSVVIIELTEWITGEAWTATDLRHSAAQRLADAGVAHIALSEFLVHADHRTANLYFDTSPTQAQRVNQALAISPIYSNVAEVARTRTINKRQLLGLPEDQQVGGVPHGIPIAGIGSCESGQSLCSKNPILSCYNCRRFLPVNDADIHDHVINQLRPIVREFAAAGRDNQHSPAYTQLRTTLDGARRIAKEIRAEGRCDEK